MTTSARPVSQVGTRYKDHDQIIANANAGVQDLRAWQDQDEARKQPVTPLNTGKKYVFRFRPGTGRSFAVRIPTLPDDYRSDREKERRESDFKRRRLAVDGDQFDLQSLREKVGGEYITFTNIPGGNGKQGTCFYATDDDEVYAFLMHRKKVDRTGKWNEIFVEYPTRTQKINGIEVPGTIAGFEAAQAAFMGGSEPSQE